MAHGNRRRRKKNRDESGCSYCRPRQVAVRMAASRELKKIKHLFEDR